MSRAAPIDATWRAAHPLPPIGSADKYARGRVLAVGGSRRLPGTIRLTAEAALRVGAGKVRIGTVESAAVALGLALPEMGVVALPEDDEGEIAAAGAPALLDQFDACDTLILGPAMAASDGLANLLGSLLENPREELSLLLDAAPMVACGARRESALSAWRGRIVMTPHHGEMSGLLGIGREAVARNPEGTACAAAERFGAVIALKDRLTFVAAPDGTLLCQESPSPGLGTAGSGDVLAGVIAGLLARGADPLVATAWGVWLHGQAGAAAGGRIGTTGYLARELLPELPRLVSGAG